MLGEGFPEALQLRASEDLFPAASVAKTTASCGSVLNLGGMSEAAWGEATGHLPNYEVFVRVHVGGGKLPFLTPTLSLPPYLPYCPSFLPLSLPGSVKLIKQCVL